MKRRIHITGPLSFLILLSCLALLLSACSKKQYLSATSEVVIYPPPPDTARVQYLTSISTSVQVEGQRSGFARFILGEEKPKPVFKPYGVFMNDSLIYLCDLDLQGLEILDLKNKTFSYFTPRGLGQLKLPINCFVDSTGYLFVADASRKQVVVFDARLNYAGAIDKPGDFKPTDVFVAYNKVWVANVLSGAVDVFSRDSAFAYLYSISPANPAAGRLYQPTNLYVIRDRLYVSDFGEFNVKSYSLEGEWRQTIGSYGRMIGQFTRPKGIAVDSSGILYVVDAAFENVQMFDARGRLLMFFGGSYRAPGDMWLPAKVMLSYKGLEYFQKFVDDRYRLKYLILVTNNFGPDKLNIYGYIEEKTNSP